MRQMPIRKQLAYVFNAAAEKFFGAPGMMCSRMVEAITDPGMKNPFVPKGSFDVVGRYHFIWDEARPVPGEKDQYTIHQCTYACNGIPFMPLSRTYSETQIHPSSGTALYFTREEAKTILKAAEESWAKQKWDISDQPYALQLVSVRRP